MARGFAKWVARLGKSNTPDSSTLNGSSIVGSYQDPRFAQWQYDASQYGPGKSFVTTESSLAAASETSTLNSSMTGTTVIPAPTPTPMSVTSIDSTTLNPPFRPGQMTEERGMYGQYSPLANGAAANPTAYNNYTNGHVNGLANGGQPDNTRLRHSTGAYGMPGKPGQTIAGNPRLSTSGTTITNGYTPTPTGPSPPSPSSRKPLPSWAASAAASRPDVKVSAEDIRACTKLVRRLYELRLEMWAMGSTYAADQTLRLEKRRQAEALLVEIQNTIGAWYGTSGAAWSPDEWDFVQSITRDLDALPSHEKYW